MKMNSPSTIVLPEDNEKIRRKLTFTDRNILFQIKKLKERFYWQKSDPEGFQNKLDELKQESKRCLIFEDEDGNPCTYSGLWRDLNGIFGWELEQKIKLPEPKHIIPWSHPPKHELRYYQKEAVEALLKHAADGPCAIEIPTGGGKTAIVFDICKRNPVSTVIITPSKNITNQIYEEMVHLFGKKFVGKYGAGKKELGKLFTVATGQALTRLEKGTEEWAFFEQKQQLIFDESHSVPCETFEVVCLGVLKNAQYRFFVSATQMRADGSELLLRGITGPVVYRKEFKDLVNEGFLAKPYFKIFNVPTYGFSGHKDVNKETKHQLYLNPNVNKLAAEFAYKAVTLANRPTIILIEEFQQFLALKNYITIPFEFAHGGSSNRENADGVKLRDILPPTYWESDVEAIVKRFNEGTTKLLIGTSAISTGIDLRPTACLINLQGGLSEIQVKQGIGRGTRIVPGKSDLIVVDFKVVGSVSMERHAEARMDIYKTLGDVEEIVK